jgi:hypothetical protein
LRLAFLFFTKILENVYPTVLHFGLAFWASCYLPGQAVHICKPAEHLANAIAVNPALLYLAQKIRSKLIWVHNLVNASQSCKTLGDGLFSYLHFILGVGKLQ